MSRRPLIAGNWKLHKTIAEATALAEAIRDPASRSPACDVLVAPVYTALAAVRDALRGSEVLLAGQNLHWEDRGAFTGEVSGALLADVGCTHVIIGHSERRQLFGDDNVKVRRRVEAALRNALVPVVCIGETLDERDSGKTVDVVVEQLDAAVSGLELASPSALVVAYEPVWAIGTGRTAGAHDAQDVHAKIRERLGQHVGGLADGIRVLYGGSVKPANAAELMGQPDIDGALVGGASLDPTSFADIIRAGAA